MERFDSSIAKVPHIGWNQVDVSGQDCKLFQGLPQHCFFYFVHSYYAPVIEGVTQATTCYQVHFSSVIQSANFIGCQFHPERSGELGLQLIENFLKV